MKKNRVFFPLLLILLLIFIPCTIYGLFNKSNPQNSNSNLNQNDENTLYYYDDKNKLIGTYECKTNDCQNAIPTVNDEFLKYNEQEGTSNKTVYSSSYALIDDGGIINLYRLDSNGTIAKFKEIKNYGYDTGELIVKDENDKYGILDLNKISFTIPKDYDFIGAIYKDNNSDQKYAVQKDNNWYLINKANEKLTPENMNPIYYYTDALIVYKTSDGYLITNINGDYLYSGITNIDIVNENIIIVASDTIYVIDENSNVLYTKYAYNASFVVEGSNISIMSDSNQIDTYTLSS